MTTATISEAASKKRGRPRVHDPVKLERMMAFVAPNVHTMRHKQNRAFVQEGFRALYDADKGGPIEGVENLLNRGNGKICVGILEQIGRLLYEADVSSDYIHDLARQASTLLREDPTMTVRKLARGIASIRADFGKGAAP